MSVPRFAVIASLMVTLTIACEHNGGRNDAAPRQTAGTERSAGSDTTAEASIDPREIDALRALGYVDVGNPLPAGAKVGVLRYDPDRAANGLNLFTNSHYCRTELMDMEGNVVHSWSHSPCFRWDNAVLTHEGDLLVVGRIPSQSTPHAASEARYLLRLGWDGTVRWKKPLPVHHDVELTPLGNILSLTYDRVLIPEVDAALPVRRNFLALLSSDGEALEKISLWNLLSDSDAFELRPVRPRIFEGASELDYLHANAVEWMRHPALVGTDPIYRENSVLVCLRHQDSVVILDWDSKKVLWAWGQGIISGPHDATMLPSGNVLLFDNGLGRGWSRTVEVDPRTDEIVWQYRASDPTSFYSKTRGSNQRLGNGNTLITDSDSGRVIEVKPDGEKVWEFMNPNLTAKREPSVIVRMRRYEGLDLDSMKALAESGQLPLVD